jgi:hypothetical protein
LPKGGNKQIGMRLLPEDTVHGGERRGGEREVREDSRGESDDNCLLKIMVCI